MNNLAATILEVDFTGLGSGFGGPVLVFKLPQWSSRTTCKIEEVCGRVLRQYGVVEKKDLTRKQMSSVPCPTFGVAAGKGCILYSGGLRLEPHLVRKLAAVEALERKSRSPGTPFALHFVSASLAAGAPSATF